MRRVDELRNWRIRVCNDHVLRVFRIAVAANVLSLNRNRRILIALIAVAVFAACDESGGGNSGSINDSKLQDLGPEGVSTPPKFEIGPVQLRILSGGGEVIEVEIGFEISNSGGLEDPDSGIVSIAIDGQDPDIVSNIESLSPGSSTVVTYSRELTPGSHQIEIDSGGSRLTREITVKSPDLELTTVEPPALGANTVAFEFRLVNVGDEPATAIALTAGWSRSEVEGDGTEQAEFEVPVEFDALAPGSARQIRFEAEIPTGLYRMAVEAKTGSIEANSENNRVEFDLGVDFVDIVPTVDSVVADDWARDGSGLVEIEVLVENRGLVPSGPTVFGASCSPDCAPLIELPAIPVGSARTEILVLQIPSGTHELRVFAGADEDTYRWGPDNVTKVEVDVPPQPAQKLIQLTDWNLVGFWPNGDAMIEFKSVLRNAGSDPIQGPVPIAIACQIDGLLVPNCGAESSVELSGGFGPTESRLELPAPMGAELYTALRGQWQSSTDYVVPQRILAVDRYVWDCYSYRLGAGQTGCSGWNSPTVTKWPKGQSVKYWVTGDQDYIDLFDELIAQTSGWLNLEFELTQSRENARFLAFLGTAADPGWGSCLNGDGCASVTVQDGIIASGAIGIWHQGSLADSEVRKRVQTALWRDFMHATTGIGTRNALDAVLGRRAATSILESEMLRFNSHPLIEPGMSMSEVEDLIVLGDQLLDPAPPSDFGIAYQAVHAAINELTRSGSARFSLTNSGSGNCFAGDYGPAIYEIGDLDDARSAIGQSRIPGFVRFVWGSHDYVIDRGSFAFARDGNGWRPIDRYAPYLATTWLEQHSGIYGLLGTFLWVIAPENLSVTYDSDGRMTIQTAIIADTSTKRMTISFDPESNQIQQFGTSFTFPGPCYISSFATAAEYGVELIDYEALR